MRFRTTARHAPESDEQRRLARLYVWQSILRLFAVIAMVTLFCVGILAYATITNPALHRFRGFENVYVLLSSVWVVFFTLFIVAVAQVAQARAQLNEFKERGIELTRELIAASVRREFISPLDFVSSVDLSADVLSSISAAEALGYSKPAAFAYNPFKGSIRLGRLRPFWLCGAIHVQVRAVPGEPTRVRVERRPGASIFLFQKGKALRSVETVVALMQVAFKEHRNSLDAIKRERELERAALEAKLYALQAQVEPHFLFNTLANLKYLIRTNSEIAQQMVDHLVGYLQTALPDMRSVSSTVRREMELAEHYLSIMQIRMGDRLRFRIDVADAALEVSVPPSMLISLVENAVKHGLERATRPGLIVISAAIEHRQVTMRVSDDGIGLVAHAGQGFGLANIHDRLRLLYADTASLSVVPGESGGVISTLSIPLPGPKDS
jgi:signal transduction histidine kinase